MDTASQVAQTILAGFNKHYRIFRKTSAEAKERFERREWRALREANRIRIDMYDTRVSETVREVARMFRDLRDESLWPGIKKAYIGLLYEHLQPELAETFFNSVAARVLHRAYHNNEHIFSRPAVATEHIEGRQPTYRSYFPLQTGIRNMIQVVFNDFELTAPLLSPKRCMRYLIREMKQWVRKAPWGSDLEPNFHVQLLSSLFYRNKGAYALGRVINGKRKVLFAVAFRHEGDEGVFVDAFLHEHEHLVNLLSVSNAYFMVDMEVPSAWVSFIYDALPDKPKAELYMSVGLQKQGKTAFFRDMNEHLKHSDDYFTIAPGTPGMVMFVFTLPSFPFVFKVIRDSFPPPKDTSRQLVMEKYRLVKLHDRVGRLADTLEYVDVAFPMARFEPELLEEMKRLIPLGIEEEREYLVIKHLYIEQRLKPLDVFLHDADDERVKHGVREFGEALRDLAAANIFPGDILPKNFGLSPYGRGLLYDYDEVMYLTDCKFRPLPVARDDEDEMRGEPWYNVGPNDIFPEEFPSFLFSDPRARAYFRDMHGDLLKPEFWDRMQKNIRAGTEPDLFPYPEEVRFPPVPAPDLRRERNAA
ncbi:MAG: bifunctional isocitrate dehydrogenase kinase/phosphatase [Bdellovibrionales bacterium GWB1_55_8]|nr:MAG: bifunctional isocitrate dehydrogenase kinase/phosphatase [Bdellovibrionales bacterium GWB1_55_8]